MPIDLDKQHATLAESIDLSARPLTMCLERDVQNGRAIDPKSRASTAGDDNGGG